MKKIILIISALALVFSLNIALAKDEPNGKLFQAIWEAINDLYEKIASIELLPGPQGQQGENGDQGLQGEPGIRGETGKDGQSGEDGINCWDLNGNRIDDPEEDVNGDGKINILDCKGEKGGKGDVGEQGIPGINGKSFRLVDGNNQDLGILLDAEITIEEWFTTYFADDNLIMRFYAEPRYSRATAVFGGGGMLYFKEANCQGDIYDAESVAIHKIVKHFKSKYYKAANSNFENITSYSQYYPSPGYCENLPYGVARKGQLLTEITLPFSEPLAYPLDIINQ